MLCQVRRPDDDPGNDESQYGPETKALKQDDAYCRCPQHKYQTYKN
ncbi:MAG: hypothetical protein R3313_05275 [Candidatus Saccharimonadales bacterium]|nr:hypothetical protein [Candidatus Saccharimonadales bacterium]